MQWLQGIAPPSALLIHARWRLASELGNASWVLPSSALDKPPPLQLADVGSRCAGGGITLLVPALLNGALNIGSCLTCVCSVTSLVGATDT